ncbi:hypothetical protein TELCIR_18301, partial [Teladorsagia circumcincta]
VVWRTRNFWRQMLARGWRFDGNKEQLPLCFTHFTLFSPNEICYLCGVETKDLNGLYKCLFDFPRDFSYKTGEIIKESLYFVGHSQGTVLMFAKLAGDPEYAKKIRQFHALAPVATVSHIGGLFKIFGYRLIDIAK